MAYTLAGPAVLLALLTANFASSASVVVQPSPFATVTEGAVLWLTCTYDLDGGTLGQLQWKDRDSANAATVTPTATPPCSSPSQNYNIDCNNLASNEVRLGILTPVDGDTYSCLVYLSNFTLIGQMSTEVSVTATTANVDVQPSPVATVTEGAVLWLTCSYNLGGGSLGQLEWSGNDGSIVATATPSAGTPCTISVSGYTIDCNNLAGNEVRLGILTPVHGDNYGCRVYLSNTTVIGQMSTQVSVIATTANVDVHPSPLATVTEGAVLWLTCTYNLEGGTLGQLRWSGNDGSFVATATPSAGTPCTVSGSGYNIDCDNLASNEVRLEILTPIHGDNYSCSVYLSNYTSIGHMSTQVSVIIQTLSLSVRPSSPVLKQELTFNCSLTMDIVTNTQVFFKRNTILVGTFYVNSTTCAPTKTQGGQNYTITCGPLPVRELLLTIPAAHVTEDEQGTDWICDIFLSGLISNIVQLTLSGAGVILTASPSPVLEGTSLTLTCSVTQNSSIYASYNFVNGSLFGAVQLSGGSCVSGTGQVCDQQCACTTDGKSYSWTIASVTGDWNKARVRCQINNPAAQTSNILVVDVIKPVTSVELRPPAGQSIVVTENQVISLTCVTSACRPSASVRWSVGGVNYTSSSASSVQTVPDDLYITTSTLSLTVTRAMTGQTVVCFASNTDAQIQATRQPVINVRHRPDIFISPIDDVITEGQTNVTLTCVATSANPPVTSLVWTREVTEVSTNGVYKLPAITPGHAGVYTCSAINDVGTSSSNITLTVLSSPTSPNIVGFTDVTSSTLTVKWAPNDKGDMANAFNISHGCKGCAAAESTSVNLTDNEDIYWSTLTNLVPESQYHVNITAINTAGSSSPLELIVSTSPADMCRSPLTDTSTTSTAVLVVGVILVLIAVAVLGISIFVYRKSRSVSKSVNRGEDAPKPVVFSNVKQSVEDKQEASVDERLHYQDLDPSDISRPSPYESLPEGNDEAGIETVRLHYQDLDTSDISRPSPYESLPEGNDEAGIENVRGNYESIQDVSVASHDYLQLKDDDGSAPYANT